MVVSSRQQDEVRDFRIRSVCMSLPSMQNPERGLFVRHRLEAMSKRARIDALCPQPWFPFLRSWSQEINPDGASFETSYLPMPYLPRIGKFLDSYWMQRTILNWLKPAFVSSGSEQILDAHFGYPEGVACWRVAQKLKIPCFVTLRGVEEEWVKQRLVRKQLRQCLESVDGIIAVSRSLASLAQKLGAKEHRIRIIPNGVDRQVFFPTKTDIVQNRTLKIVCVGNLRHVKGHDTLLRAFARLAKLKFEFELRLIGEATEPTFARSVEHLISELGLVTKVKNLGSLNQLKLSHVLRQSDLFVLASRREGCCNAILEALASGLPVVATDVGDNHKYVRSGINGQLVAADDEIALAKAIQHVARQEFDHQAVSESVAICSWDQTAQEVIEFMAERLSA
ncbi:MAG: glycosyltransferase [Planctomycetota bacterium]|nr:glycosyltransferase [Planctomycetota bacterium]